MVIELVSEFYSRFSSSRPRVENLMRTLSQSRPWDKDLLGGEQNIYRYIERKQDNQEKAFSKISITKWTTTGLVELNTTGETLGVVKSHASEWSYQSNKETGIFIQQLLIVIGWGLLSKESYFPSTSGMPSQQEKHFVVTESHRRKIMWVFTVRSQVNVHWSGKDVLFI